MPATIRDVARAAGVHISTVSRTFSAPHLVNPETRTRVLAEAEGLGYRPNRAARALITGRTNNIGLIVADIANPFFPPLIKAAESQARSRDYHVFVADTNEDAGVEEELVHALAKQVDGILLCSPRMNNSLIERLSREVPLVVINRIVAGLPAVVMDVAQGARRAIEHLVGLGHRDIAFVAGPRGSWTNREIRRAATGAARTHGVNLVVLGPSQPTEDAGEAAAEAVVRSGVTAVLTYNDLMAVGLLEGLDQLGVRVPLDLSVVGIDDIELSRRIRPKLTTVATPNAAAGRAAVDMLLQPDDHGPARAGRGSNRSAASDGSGPRGSHARAAHRASDDDRRTTAQVTLQTHLIIRDSTGPGPHWPADPGYAASAVSPGAVASYIKE